ncbi:hypothetical protein Gpo141_00008527 [Globisporangium polare]
MRLTTTNTGRRLQRLAVLSALLLCVVNAQGTTFTGTTSVTFADLESSAGSNGGSGDDASTAGNGGSATTPKPSTTTTKKPTATTKPPANSSSSKPKSTSKSKAKTTATAWQMKSVTAIHARVQSDEPLWDDEHGAYVSKFGSSFDEQYRGALDTVNTASVEGALMYVQAEGINVKEQSVKCERKNKMEFVVFYEMQIAQTANSVAQYQAYAPTIEYCPYVAMDVNRCTPVSGDDKLPKECYQYNGLNDEPNLGPCVGGESKDSDFRAPYPNTYWFSFPNSCPGTSRTEKTDKCRAAQPGGLCPFGMSPDGKACTYAYKILGYIKLDDLVGITSLTSEATGDKYKNFKEFCEAGGVEFDAENDQSSQTLTVKSALPFWKDPTSAKANQARFQKMVSLYNKNVKQSAATMSALPSVAQLQQANPPCYENNIQCASSQYGCKRVNYYQVCELCEGEKDDSCVAAPEGFSFPTLAVDTKFQLDPNGSLESGKFLDKNNSTSGSEDESASSSSEDGDVEALNKSAGSDDLTIEGSPTPTPSATKASKKAATTSAAVQACSSSSMLLAVAMSLVLVSSSGI